MPYILTRAELGSINDAELAFSTQRLLPAWKDIPENFKVDGDNLYLDLVNALLYGGVLPDVKMEFMPEFEDEEAPADLNKCVRAHLQSWGPKHEHKLSGVAFMISLVCTLHSVAQDS